MRQPPADSVDLDPLDEFLMSGRAPDESMGLSDLDGFLTGVVIGPELIKPSEWIPVIWGGGEPEFESVAEVETVIGTIIRRYNEIIGHLDGAAENFDPVFGKGPEGQIIVTDWAAGFLDAALLRPKAWEPLVKNLRARALMMPLLVLGADNPQNPPFGQQPISEEEVEKLLEAGAEIIPECVVGINAFWRAHPGQPKWGTRTERRARRGSR